MSKQEVPRSSDRRELDVMIKGRVQSRAIYVDLIDISEGGCKLRGGRGFADVGDRVTMKVNGVHTPLGKIVWLEDRLAGVAFEGEMHSAVLDHLCAMNLADHSLEKQRLHRI
jgi:hypothetical protein